MSHVSFNTEPENICIAQASAVHRFAAAVATFTNQLTSTQPKLLRHDRSSRFRPRRLHSIVCAAARCLTGAWLTQVVMLEQSP